MSLQSRITSLAQAVGADVKSLQTALTDKQTALTSGTNIKTVNGQSVLGSGSVVVPSVSVDGPVALGLGETATYTITNWSQFSTYSVSASAGAASIVGNTITFTSPTSIVTAVITVTRDGVANTFPVDVSMPLPTPTPAAYGDPLEGGFYAGMIWNQLTQSSTSQTKRTGIMAFDIPAGSLVGVTYPGQLLEIRSRANPGNNLVGTVQSTTETQLIMNITSTGGAWSMASDWSIMARFRIIVAPKASGENAGIRLKNSDSAFPTVCQTITEGWLATNAMYTAGTDYVYPAAHWARSLNIGGRTDWYIQSRDELEVCFRNLKPTTDINTTSSRSTGEFNYANLGSYNDTAATHGTNNNSVPPGAAYTTATPGQTTNILFQAGATESFVSNASYWTSSEARSFGAWLHHTTSFYGFQDVSTKSSYYSTRAVRRSMI